MKAPAIISALIFAHVALGQATNSTSAATSSSAHASQSSSKAPAGNKSSTQTQSSSVSSSVAPYATPTGSTGSTGLSGPLTESYTADSNPLIPADISAGCSSFLSALNSDTTISNCLTPLSNAVSSFSSGSGSTSAVSKTLDSLCSSNSCSASSMRAKLTDFKDACSSELAASNDMIVKQYDVWYSLVPFKLAICAKDTDTQAYCLLNTSTSSNSSQNTRRSDVIYAANHLANSVRKRTQTVIMPNTDTYRNSKLMYLFTSPDMTADQLCTSCTQQIVSKYIAFESGTPYALGLTQSPLLGGQSELWSAMQEKCPTNFMSQVTNIAGVASADQLSGAVVTTTAGYFTTLAAAFAAAFALF